MITREQVAQEVERLEAAGMGHGKALLLVKQRIVETSRAQQQALVAAAPKNSVLTAQVTVLINQMHRGRVYAQRRP